MTSRLRAHKHPDALPADNGEAADRAAQIDRLGFASCGLRGGGGRRHHPDPFCIPMQRLRVRATPAIAALGAGRATLALVACSCRAGWGAPATRPRTPRPAPALTVTIVSLPPTGPGNVATATAHTAPSAICSITVEYKSGPSTAGGLDPKTAAATGTVAWSWLVDTRKPG